MMNFNSVTVACFCNNNSKQSRYPAAAMVAHTFLSLLDKANAVSVKKDR